MFGPSRGDEELVFAPPKDQQSTGWAACWTVHGPLMSPAITVVPGDVLSTLSKRCNSS